MRVADRGEDFPNAFQDFHGCILRRDSAGRIARRGTARAEAYQRRPRARQRPGAGRITVGKRVTWLRQKVYCDGPGGQAELGPCRTVERLGKLDESSARATRIRPRSTARLVRPSTLRHDANRACRRACHHRHPRPDDPAGHGHERRRAGDRLRLRRVPQRQSARIAARGAA